MFSSLDLPFGWAKTWYSEIESLKYDTYSINWLELLNAEVLEKLPLLQELGVSF